MKLSKEVLIEIVSIVQDGILEGRDISDGLRDLDLIQKEDQLNLSEEYVAQHPRANVWIDDETGEA